MSKPARCVNEDNFSVSFETGEDPVMKLRVLSDPGVAVVDIGGRNIIVRHVRQDNEPLLKKLGAKSTKK